MKANSYCIHSFYRANSEPTTYSDVEQQDGWQLEVYLRALGLLIKHDYRSIIDVGCGSGYKLVHYFKGYETTGIDTAATCEWLGKTYPGKKWLVSDFAGKQQLAADLVICSDVIEHVSDPDELLAFLNKIEFKYLIISTPCREVLYPKWHKLCYLGPPTNKAHIREWSFKEFESYISSHFKIIDHKITNIPQATQMVICEKMQR